MTSREPLPTMTGFVLLQFPGYNSSKETSVPSIFPDYPSYLSEWNSKPKRLSLDYTERLLMESAYSTKSITDNEKKVDKFLVSSFSDILS